MEKVNYTYACAHTHTYITPDVGDKRETDRHRKTKS